MGFSIGNTKGCHTTTGKSTADLSLFRLPGVPTFDNRLATVIRDNRRTNRVIFRTETGKLGSKGLMLCASRGWVTLFTSALPRLLYGPLFVNI